MCCTCGGESVGGREHAGAFQGGRIFVFQMALGPLNTFCQFDVSRFFAWLSLRLVVDNSVMVCGLPSGVAPSCL